MCGRYTLIFTVQEAVDAFNVTKVMSEFKMNFNVAPSQDCPVIFAGKKDCEKVLDNFKWGFVPAWAKDEKMGFKMINARGESVAEKPSYKKSFIQQRCLIPASGFFEWEKKANKKIPHYLTLKNRSVFSFAGIYSKWKKNNKTVLNTFSIITTNANSLMNGIHDRMPVILPKNKEKIWLDKKIRSDRIDEVKSLLKPYPSNKMKEHIVSDLVNNPMNNTKDILEKIKSSKHSLDKWM
jgi:putative SOS response-associated peptidase YedK